MPTLQSEQLSLLDLAFTSERESRPTPIAESLPLPPPKTVHWVGCYDKKVKNLLHPDGQQVWYVRYYWMTWSDGRRKTNHCHIPGGCADTPIVGQRRAEVERWIAEGQSPLEIRRAIAGWSDRHHRGWNLNQNRKIPATIPPCDPAQELPGSLAPGR
jgi:hypothetical protein